MAQVCVVRMFCNCFFALICALSRVLSQDAYGNYVMQSSLSVAKGALHAELVEKIRPHLVAIKSSPYGKRILARSHLFQQKSRASSGSANTNNNPASAVSIPNQPDSGPALSPSSL